MGPAIQNMFGLLAMMDRNDIPVYAGDVYSVVTKDTGVYGCEYTSSIPLYPSGKTWSDTVMGFNYKYFPKPASDDRNYYPNFPESIAQLPQMINKTAADRVINFVCLSPFSTINRLFTNNPWIKSRVNHIYAMGGAVFVPGNLFFPIGKAPNKFSESNIYVDPQSALAVFQSGVPLTLVPLDATNNFNANNLTFIKKSMYPSRLRTNEAKLSFDILNRTAVVAPPTFVNSIWDVVAMTAMLNPSLIVQSGTYNLTVITALTANEPNQVGKIVVDNVNGNPITVVTKLGPETLIYFAKILNTPSTMN
eukprot:gene14259-16831_t